jgi:ABC-type lipoprotein release transport system permease subunit
MTMAALLFIMVVVALAVLIPVLRAVSVDPMQALRTE